MSRSDKKPRAVILEIAGVRLAFSFRDPAFFALAAKRYAPFISRGRPAFRLEVCAITGKQSPFRPVVVEAAGLLRGF
jgi:hypothetical protein